MDDQQELLEVVDRWNRLIGQASRGMIHRLGLRHRAVHIFVFDQAGRLYLQLRRWDKDQYPGHWDSSAAGHVSPGESYDAAAARELAEELGIREELTRLADVTACPETGWEQVVLFYCRTDVEPAPNSEEIETGGFFSLEEIDRMVVDANVPITSAFRLLYGLWKDQAGREGSFLLPRQGVEP
jgi:isopentenyl-diphosphate delta-isomerase